MRDEESKIYIKKRQKVEEATHKDSEVQEVVERACITCVVVQFQCNYMLTRMVHATQEEKRNIKKT